MPTLLAIYLIHLSILWLSCLLSFYFVCWISCWPFLYLLFVFLSFYYLTYRFYIFQLSFFLLIIMCLHSIFWLSYLLSFLLTCLLSFFIFDYMAGFLSISNFLVLAIFLSFDYIIFSLVSFHLFDRLVGYLTFCLAFEYLNGYLFTFWWQSIYLLTILLYHHFI